jgi:hypothetical protein
VLWNGNFSFDVMRVSAHMGYFSGLRRRRDGLYCPCSGKPSGVNSNADSSLCSVCKGTHETVS